MADIHSLGAYREMKEAKQVGPAGFTPWISFEARQARAEQLWEMAVDVIHGEFGIEGLKERLSARLRAIEATERAGF